MNKQKGLAPILIILLLTAATFGYLIYSGKINLPQNTSQQVVSLRPDKTLKWKDFQKVNNYLKFQIKYPEDVKIDEFENYVVFYKGEKRELPPGSPLDPYPSSLAVYYRTGIDAVGNLKDVSISGYNAKIREGDNVTDYWIFSKADDMLVRISFDKKDEDFATMINTFKFTN